MHITVYNQSSSTILIESCIITQLDPMSTVELPCDELKYMVMPNTVPRTLSKDAVNRYVNSENLEIYFMDKPTPVTGAKFSETTYFCDPTLKWSYLYRAGSATALPGVQLFTMGVTVPTLRFRPGITPRNLIRGVRGIFF
jgi:hypothetical protein